MLNRTLIAGIVATSCLCAPVAAQEPERMAFCAYQPALDDLVGVYKVEAGPSALSSGGVTIPNPNIETYQTTLALIGGELVLYTDDGPSIDLHPVGADEPNWVGPDNVGGIPVTSTEDIGIAMGCDMNTLVRLVGTGIGTSQEGRRFEFTIRLFAGLDGLLVGGNTWTIDGMTMRQRLVYSEIGN